MPLFRRRPKPIPIESPDQIIELAQSGTPVFVEFMQWNCNPCQVMDGVVDELAEEFHGTAHVARVNAAHAPLAFERFKVKSTPTFVVLSGGDGGITQRWRASGIVKKDQLVAALHSAGATPDR